MTPQRETRQLADLLRLKILSAGRSQRQVERQLGWGKGYISQLLRGSFDLKVKHVYAILEQIGLAPTAFFAELYGLAPADPALTARRQGLAPAGLEAAALEALRPQLKELVREVLAEERALPPGPRRQRDRA